MLSAELYGRKFRFIGSKVQEKSSLLGNAKQKGGSKSDNKTGKQQQKGEKEDNARLSMQMMEKQED